MVITKIEPQKKNKNRCSVFIDGTFSFGISEFDAKRFQLQEGMILSDEDINSIRNDILIQDAKQYVLRLLDRKEYTEIGLKRKMTERGFDSVTIDSTINFLKEYHYIDDVSFADRYIRSALQSGKSGIRKIQYDLQNKGIASEIITKILCEIDCNNLYQNEYETVKSLVLKKTKGDFSFPSLMKAKRYCFSRGFSTDVIDSVIQKVKNDDFENLSDI